MPYENISGLADLDAEPKLKIAIVGEPKTGKSWLAMTAPGPIFVADFDQRLESIKEFVRKSKRTDITAKTYWDPNPSMPNAVSQLETDISMLEYLKQQGKEYPATYILDSMTFLRAACEHELIKQHPSMSRTIKLGANTLKIPSGWDIINGNRGYMEYLIGRLSELGHVIAIFHEQDEKDAQNSTKEQKAYTGRKTVQPQYLNTLLSVFNDVFRITIDYSGSRIVTVQPTTDFLASTSMNLDATEAPDIMQMLAKHKKRSA
jgi:AAA domain